MVALSCTSSPNPGSVHHRPSIIGPSMYIISPIVCSILVHHLPQSNDAQLYVAMTVCQRSVSKKTGSLSSLFLFIKLKQVRGTPNVFCLGPRWEFLWDIASTDERLMSKLVEAKSRRLIFREDSSETHKVFTKSRPPTLPIQQGASSLSQVSRCQFFVNFTHFTLGSASGVFWECFESVSGSRSLRTVV